MKAAHANTDASLSSESTNSTRENILKAAAHEFATRGYHAATMTHVELSTGYSRGTLYYHFPSKDKLLFEICWSNGERQLQAVQAVAAETDSLDRTMKRLVTSVLDEIFTNRDSVLVAQRELQSLSSEEQQLIRSLRDSYEEVWAEILGRSARQGECRPVDHVELKALLGMLVSAAVWIKEGPLSKEQLVERFGGLILRSINSETDTSVAGAE